MENKMYKTMSRGMYNYLIERGHTNVTYEQNEYGKIVFAWEESNKLNKDIISFYNTDRDMERRKRAKVIGVPWLVEALKELGYRPFAQEVSIFDWRKPVYLYDKSNSLQEAIDRLLAERSNKANILIDKDVER